MSPTPNDQASFTAKGAAATDEIHDGIHRIKRDFNETAHAVRDDLEGVAHQAGQYVRQTAGSIEDSMTAKIRDNPVQSSVIALGVGIIVGLWMRRS